MVLEKEDFWVYKRVITDVFAKKKREIVLPFVCFYETGDQFTHQTYLIVLLFCYANDPEAKLASKREFVNL